MKTNFEDIPCMILCGGRGTRLSDVTEQLPKPMVPIGEYPIVVHIMKWYAKFGVKRFILCLGYKKQAFVDYFVNFKNNANDITIDYSNDSIDVHEKQNIDWKVTLVDTGLNSKTGLRVKIASKYLLDSDKQLFLTYGDGLSNIDMRLLYESHMKSAKNITISSVKNPSRFGMVETDSIGTVHGFNEKTGHDSFINGGFMLMERNFIDCYLKKDEDVFLEQEPFSRAIDAEDMHAYVHNGFWQCMDNSKEYKMLNDIWNNGNAEWK